MLHRRILAVQRMQAHEPQKVHGDSRHLEDHVVGVELARVQALQDELGQQQGLAMPIDSTLAQAKPSRRTRLFRRWRSVGLEGTITRRSAQAKKARVPNASMAPKSLLPAKIALEDGAVGYARTHDKREIDFAPGTCSSGLSLPGSSNHIAVVYSGFHSSAFSTAG